MLKVAVFVSVLVFTMTICRGDYWSDRTNFISKDASRALGGSVVLTPEEEEVNKILMTHKFQEYDSGFADPSTFPPARHFFQAREQIEESEVFKFIRKIPKGASLHAHDTALASSEFVFNITYSENLYGCVVDGRLKLHFFDGSHNDTSCDWKTLRALRQENENFDEYLKSQLTIIVDDPHEAYKDINVVWKVFVDTFQTVTPMITHRPVFKDYFRQALLELYEDNVKYLEFRGTLPKIYDLDGRVYDQTEAIRVYKEVLEEFSSDYPDFLGARFIYAPQRLVDNKTVQEYIKNIGYLTQIYPDFVAGFDLVGQEDKGRPLSSFAKSLHQVAPHTKFFFHAGETNWLGTDSDVNLVDAILLGTKRIGHGYAVAKHPVVMEEIKKRNIAIEVCPISHQVLKLVDDLRNHPAAYLIAEGFPIVICNDDPSFWGSRGLSYDWYVTFMGLASREADLRFLKQLANNSLAYSAMPEDEKYAAIAQWENDWMDFIRSVLGENDYGSL